MVRTSCKGTIEMNVVYCQIWEESERGWGTRPDGHSLHLTFADAEQFRKEYLDHQHEYFESIGVKGVPDEYTRPYGDPYQVKVGDELYEQLAKDKNIRFNDNAYPERLIDREQ
jgi:hypothetical protein